MKREEILPHLNQFITVTLTNGSGYSGYVVNAKEIRETLSDDQEIQLINGLIIEKARLEDIVSISFPVREETTNLPVISGPEDNDIRR